MKKVLTTLIISIFFISGCSIIKVSDKSVSDVMDTILYVDNNLSNTYMEGYSLYLPQGMKLIDKADYNLKIQDDNSIYYLYIDTIAYHYHVKSTYTENTARFYSKRFEHNGKEGFIDVTDNGNYYFVVLMYNYAKFEAYVKKENFNTSIMNMCSILSTIKYNDKVISGYVGDKTMIFKEEHFDIFEANVENDNFLKYEEEYGTYNAPIIINQDNDIIDVDETIE